MMEDSFSHKTQKKSISFLDALFQVSINFFNSRQPD